MNMLYESELKQIILLFSSKENSTVLNILYEQMPITLLFFLCEVTLSLKQS